MKALMEATREESPERRNPQAKEFSKTESRQDWKYLEAIAKEGMAA